MSPTEHLPIPELPPRRAFMVTVMAWTTILISALLLPISFITLLMIFARSYGTASANVAGFLSVVVAPPVTLVAGIGLLRRWPWARFYMMALVVILIVLNVSALRTGGMSTTTYTSAAGVTTTKDVWGGSNFYSLPIIVICGLALVKLLTPSVRREFLTQRKVDASAGPVAGAGVP